MQGRFFRFKSVPQAYQTLRENWRCVELLRARLAYEAKKNDAIFNLVAISANYLKARDQGEEGERKKALKQINKWVAGYESDAQALDRYYRLIHLAQGYLTDNGEPAKEIYIIAQAGCEDGKAEARKRGY